MSRKTKTSIGTRKEFPRPIYPSLSEGISHLQLYVLAMIGIDHGRSTAEIAGNL